MRQMIPTVLVCVILVAAAFVMGMRAAGGHGAEPVDHAYSVQSLHEALNLSSEQMKVLNELERDYEARLLAYCGEHCGARALLASDLMKGDWHGEHIRGRVEQMAAAQVRSDMAAMEHMKLIREQLDDAQRNQFDRLLADRLGNACPYNHHSGMIQMSVQ